PHIHTLPVGGGPAIDAGMYLGRTRSGRAGAGRTGKLVGDQMVPRWSRRGWSTRYVRWRWLRRWATMSQRRPVGVTPGAGRARQEPRTLADMSRRTALPYRPVLDDIRVLMAPGVGVIIVYAPDRLGGRELSRHRHRRELGTSTRCGVTL